MCVASCLVDADVPKVCDVCGSTAGPQAAGAARSPRPPVRMCVRCDRITAAPVLVSEVHSASGPGFNVYACAECAPLLPKPPDALDLLATGRRTRAESGH
ncbi:hypothetical protein AB0M39_10425 [Streptomyces sp. NPDC051907]|uniref:hypothetical protein n=1 Tax=Streptomyces sp. NPDC051907 TaxID=3155284 RepID=UPI00341F03AE